jgi:hypothetical protein
MELGLEPKAIETMEMLSNKVFIIESFTLDKETYTVFIETFYEYIKQGFEHKEFRTHPVYFKFFDREDEFIHSLELRHFVTNLMMWEPLIRLEKFNVMNTDYVVDCARMSSNLIKNYIDEMIIIPFRKEFGNRKLNKIIHDMIHNLSRISNDFNVILGLSMNVETFIHMAEKNPRFNEIIRTKIDDSMQPKEIEAYIDSLMDEQIEILRTEDNFLRPIIMSGTGIKAKQLAEFSINGGMKPDLHDNTIPIPINSNFIVGGLSNVTNYYLDSLGGRKSAIMNKTVMGKSGHFSRMVMLLASDVRLKKKGEGVEDCGTLYGVGINIRSAVHLHKLIGRYYRLPHVREYKVLRGTEKHLIGMTVIFRSPARCAGEKLCKKCYGEMYYTNRDIKSVGGYAGTQVTNPLSQSILSSKHLLTTQSEEIQFNEEFYKFFTISLNEIMLNAENEDIDITPYSLVIIKDNIITIDQFDENDYNSYILIFHLKHKKTGEMIEIRELNGGELYISQELKEIMDNDRSGKDFHEIPLANMSFEDKLFVMEITNNELTKPLYSIMNLLNRSDHEGCTTIDEMAQKMLDLMIESKFAVDSVHGEILIRPLIRSSKDILKTPNYRRYVEGNEYRILTVDSALQNHPSVLVSLSFQDLGRQLTKPVTFRKTATSFVDPFFRERP